MSKEIKNITASIRAKLQNKAIEQNRPFAEILQYFAMERFLYRLSRSKYAKKFILKGALMFTAWLIPDRRVTLDIDLSGKFDNEVEAVENVIRDICSIKYDDGLIFDTTTIKGERIKEDADYEGVRIKFKGFLERSRIPMQIDIAFGDVIYPKPKFIDYPVILNFPKPRLAGYPIETVISEKLEAIIKLGSLNSRMKDFYDIWLMIHKFKLDIKKLSKALKKTFSHRKTQLPKETPLFVEEFYDDKSDRQMLWTAFLKKGNIKNVPSKLSRLPYRPPHVSAGVDVVHKSS